MHSLLSKALMVWLTPPDNWSIFLHLEVLSLLYLGETINSLFLGAFVSAFQLRARESCTWVEPLIVPHSEPSISLQRGLGQSMAGLCEEQGHEGSLLPTECPAWGQVRATPNKALAVCVWGGNGRGDSARLQCQLFCTSSGHAALPMDRQLGFACWKGMKF